MNTIFKMVLAVIAGLFVGGLVNYGLITLSPMVISPPEGVDVTDVESLKDNMYLFQPKNFIFPFLAHALGTLVGAFTTAKIAGVKQINLGLIIGAVFLLGGISMVMSVPSPTWFNVLDLVGAYFPMGWLGAKLASNNNVA